jgi:NADH:ubiquinone oxidoreductase subunit F (NADH-binding)/(2Fe-2S) ferredoxin
MNAQLQSIIDAAKAAWEAERKSGRIRVNVCIDTSSLAVRGDETLAALRKAATDKGLAVDVGITGSAGFCWLEPTVTVRSADASRTVLYGQITPDRVAEFVSAVLVEGRDLADLAIGVVEGPSNGIPMLDDHQIMKGQVRRLMANTGTTDPENIDHYFARGGYEGFGKALEMDAEAIVKEMVDSGLGGRGGSGFPSGRKWDFLRTATASPRYLVCNADEGDPGAWVNRVLLEGDPQLILEGLLIASLASLADAAYIYLRYEYPLANERLRIAIEQARAKGLLGTNILGSGKDFDIFVVRGAGSYVCGDETGLISSIDGYRGMPRIKPPFPAQAGLWNKPTNVNNVESYANAPLILRGGAAWWSNVSEVAEKGTKMFNFSGDVNFMSCVEIPFGLPMRQALEQYAGGIKDGRPCKAIQPGGPLSGVISGDELDLPMTITPYRERGIFLGGGGIMFLNDTRCIVDLSEAYAAFCEAESCGRCTTCHGGSQRVVEILRRISRGGGRESDIDKLEDIAKTMFWSNCQHGQLSPNCFRSAIKFFREELLEHIVEKRCRAQVCAGLVEYRITDQGSAQLPEAVAICPTSAIRSEGGAYAIDDVLCIRCGACKEVAPGAFELRDRVGAPASV